MTDSDIYRKALARYRAATGENTVFKDNVIVFLEKEIDRYSGAFRHMQYNVECMKGKNDELKARLNAIYGVQTAGAITEQLEEWKKETEQRVKIIEERTSDSGKMTINYSGCYQDLVGILLANGYFVCCHVNNGGKKSDETITIEFWKE